ncbi:MAG: hypothetical protein JW913_20545 [Chitinispirillaceae bacterium]|nr:hypothetical protein [Chitinispirillaceae bacterium]
MKPFTPRLSKARICSLVISADGCMRLPIEGSSMEPVIAPQETVTVKKHAALIPGNCYLFQFNNALLMHRLIARKGSTVHFIGDSSGSIESVPIRSVMAECIDPSTRFFRIAVFIVNIACTFTAIVFRTSLPRWTNRIRKKIIRMLHSVDCIFHRVARFRVSRVAIQEGDI